MFSLCDIDPVSDDLKRIAFIIINQPHLIPKPEICSVFVSESVFMDMVPPAQQAFQSGGYPVSIICVDMTYPEFWIFDEFFRIIPDLVLDVVLMNVKTMSASGLVLYITAGLEISRC